MGDARRHLAQRPQLLGPDQLLLRLRGRRLHAEFALSDDVWKVADLGSSNGTFLNGARLGSVEESFIARLKPGCELEVDGGINAGNISEMKSAGITAFVAATAVFKHPQGIAAGIQALRSRL